VTKIGSHTNFITDWITLTYRLRKRYS